MIRKFFFTILALGLLITFRLSGQKPVLVVESSIKVAPFSEEFFYYGFAKGDKLIFSFEEANNKELKEVEIMEMPSSSKFMEYKTKKIENRTIAIVKQGIYKFRFANSTIFPKLCKYNIQRIPASDLTKDFNTAVYTHTVNDTSYITEEESYIDRTDTVISNLQDRVVKIQAPSSTVKNKASFNFVLPENTIAWSYYIYTDEPGKEIYEEALRKVGTSPEALKFANFTPLAAVTFGKESYLHKLPAGKNVIYWIVEGENANLFMNGAQFRYLKKETVVNDFSKMNFIEGNLNFCFGSVNSNESVTVTVKITCYFINEVLKTRNTQRISVKPRTEMYLQN